MRFVIVTGMSGSGKTHALAIGTETLRIEHIHSHLV